jgi:uncharacterized protein YndB with AHSA1/START domain
MSENLIARVSTVINTPAARVWDALVTPATIKKYMFGTNVVSDWQEGSPITWSGEWQGKQYQDRGTILRVIPGRMLQHTHFSPLAGLPDIPENYHTVTVELATQGSGTRVSIAQDKNPTEEARQHSEQNWTIVIQGLKKLLEESA